MKYLAYLLNFGTHVYEGASWIEAKAAAEKTGFECVVICSYNEEVIERLVLSPIGGWRSIG